MRTLEKLSLGNALFSEADLERLKTDLPHVAIKFTLMPDEKRVLFEKAEVVRDPVAELLKLAEPDRAAKLKEIRQSDVALFNALLPVLQRLNALPKK